MDTRRSLRLALLFIALAAVAFTTYQPHWRPDQGRYDFPLHVDEYVHWGFAQAVQTTGLAEPGSPFTESHTGFEPPRVGYPSAIHERGYHTYLAALQSTLGVAWTTFIVAAPLVVSLLITLLVFVLAEQWRAGAEAALFFAMVPTSLRFLGPGFLVPIVFAMILVLAMLWIFTLTGGRPAVALFIIAAALWPIHAMGAVMSAILATFALLLAKPSGWTLRVAPAVGIPFLLGWPYLVADLDSPALRLNALPLSLEVVRLPGAALYTAAAIGIVFMALSKRHGAVAGAIGLTAIMWLGVIIYRALTGDDILRLYDRATTTLPFLLCIAAGVGVARVAEGAWLRRSTSGIARRAPIAVAGFFIIGMLAAPIITANAAQPYYHLAKEDRVALYEDAGNILGRRGQIALVDGLDTMLWTDITGIATIYPRLPGSLSPPPEVEKFLAGASQDTTFLVEHGVTVVVTDRHVDNALLTPVLPGVYVLDGSVAGRM